MRNIYLAGAAIVLLAGAAIAQAQTPAPTGPGAAAAPGGATPARGARGARGAGGGGGQNGVNPGIDTGGAGIGSAEVATQIWEEHWTDVPPAGEPMLQRQLSNRDFELHLYGDSDHIRGSEHPTEDYTYMGECITTCGLTLRDPKNYWDLTGAAKFMLRTRNSGYRFTHVIIKTLDGKWFASEEGSPESTSWIDREYALPDLHWRILLMTDTPSNPSNQRKPDPKLVPLMPLGPGKPDLTKVDEIGFSDLMPGGWIPSTSRINRLVLFGKKVAR